MSLLFDNIKTFLRQEVHMDNDTVEGMQNSTVSIALAIALYAHRKQRRVNGELYAHHPLNVYNHYKDLLGIDDDKIEYPYFSLFGKLGIPYYGVKEVCLLHDVIEDTDITMKDIEMIYGEFESLDYFNIYIKEPLLLITHDKSVRYDDYIDILIKNPTSAFVKMLDICDNLNLSTLDKFAEKEYRRSKHYLKIFYRINREYRFIEKCIQFKKEYAVLRFTLEKPNGTA